MGRRDGSVFYITKEGRIEMSKLFINNQDIDKIQNDDMYKKFGIIKNQIYFIKLKNDDKIIQGYILNFNYSKYFVKAYDGHYVVDIDEIELLKPSNLTKERYTEKCLKHLEKHTKEW